MCLELSKGPLVYALQKYDYLKRFPVNPATLAKYRQAFIPSQAKDDPTENFSPSSSSGTAIKRPARCRVARCS